MWHFEPALKARIIRRLPPDAQGMAFMLLTSEQRRIDMASRHFNYLLAEHEKRCASHRSSNNGAPRLRTAAEWGTLICEPAALRTAERLDPGQQMTAKEFGCAMLKQWQTRGYEYVREYTPPQTPIPGKCDVCSKRCSSECGICGESYCSKVCQKKGFPQHRRICETVFDNGSLDSRITNMEMCEMLTEEEKRVALGVEEGRTQNLEIGEVCLTCGKVGQFKACAGCCKVWYCDRKCQKKDWKTHKPNCNKV